MKRKSNIQISLEEKLVDLYLELKTKEHVSLSLLNKK